MAGLIPRPVPSPSLQPPGCAGSGAGPEARSGGCDLARRFSCAALLVLAGAARAQTAGRPYRLAILWHAESAEGEGPMFTAVMEGLRERGLFPGRNLVVEHRFAAERPERFKAMAAELVTMRPDVLMGLGPQAVVALKATGTDLPVVFAAIGDPQRLGLVQSWNRPGTNFTGFTVLGPDLAAKQLQLLLDLLPGTKQVGFLHNPDSPTYTRFLTEALAAAAATGVTVTPFAARDPAEISAAFAKMADAKIKATLTAVDSLMFRERELVAREALARGVAEVSAYRENLVAGSLMTYGANLPDSARRSTEYIARILKGESPRDLPVVGPTRFDLLVNRKTARALGIVVPASILLRADEVLD